MMKAQAQPVPAQIASDSHIFVTGFPGFIGKRLCARILREWPDVTMTLLVHEKFVSDAKKYLSRIKADTKKRVELLAGDVAKMDLGLSGPEIDRLSAATTHVFHLAAYQYAGGTLADFEHVNIRGTRNMLMLAREMKKLSRFVHFSTCYVSGDRTGVITEEDLDQDQGFKNPYEETKFRAEKLARQAMAHLPITVIRPSIVVGDSETGEIDRFDGMYSMGILIVASPIGIPIPIPGDGTAPLNVVPVDFVTRAAMTLATQDRAASQTFHLVDPNPLSARHVYELIAKKAGKTLPRVRISYGITRRLLRMPFIEKLTRRQAQAIDYMNHLAIYNCMNTLEHLEGTGILCPRIDTYVDRLMEYAGEALRQQRDPKKATEEPLNPYDLDRMTGNRSA